MVTTKGIGVRHIRMLTCSLAVLVALGWAISVLSPVAGTYDDHAIVAVDGALFILTTQCSVDAAELRALMVANRPGTAFSLPMHIGTSGRNILVVPMWLPLVCLVVATICLPRRRRRIPIEDCQKCGYSLHKNTSGVCPECGEKVAERPAVPARQG